MSVACLRTPARLALMMAMIWPTLRGEAAQPAPMVIRETRLDPATDTITIVGEHFGQRVFATLDLVPVDVRLTIDTRVVIGAPLGKMPAADYLLTISRGSGPGDTASVTVAIGGEAPATTPQGGSGSVVETAPAAATDVAARAGTRAITVADVDREWQRVDPGTYAALMQELYVHRRRVTEQMVQDELLAREAAARGVTRDQLLADELPKRRMPMPDSAVSALFQSLGDRARGASLDEMRPALREWLERHTEPELARMAYIEELMKTSTRAQVELAAPRLRIARSPQDPMLGPPSAPVSLVAFGDLQHPEYARLAQSFGRIRDTYGDRVHVVFKGLPMFGAQSAPIAEAAQCAHDQGRFWAYHDAALKPGVLDAARLSAMATEAGLARDRYEACVASGTHRAQSARALAEAQRYGLSRGPAVVVNGRLAPEPPPFLPLFEYLSRLVEEELLRLSRAPLKGGG